MKAQVLKVNGPVENLPLSYEEVETPEPKAGEIRLKVLACGVCLTDRHIIEGDVLLKKCPIIPGHQIVGKIDKLGEGVMTLKEGDVVGVPWLHSTCNQCTYCKSHVENLCDKSTFTGYHEDGGYAEYAIAKADYIVNLPGDCDPVQVAPLLCGGIVGYRSFKLSNIQPNQKLGLFGFGSSAHQIIQVAKHHNIEVEVYTRSENHRQHALELGASRADVAEKAVGRNLDSAIIFAPNGDLVPLALKSLRKGGTLAVNAIYTTDIPVMKYETIYNEKILRTVSHATREDAREYIDLALRIGIKCHVTTYPLEKAGNAIAKSKNSEVEGSIVIIPT